MTNLSFKEEPSSKILSLIMLGMLKILAYTVAVIEE